MLIFWGQFCICAFQIAFCISVTKWSGMQFFPCNNFCSSLILGFQSKCWQIVIFILPLFPVFSYYVMHGPPPKLKHVSFFLATLVALHFTPVSKWLSGWAEFRTSVAPRLASLFLKDGFPKVGNPDDWWDLFLLSLSSLHCHHLHHHDLNFAKR